ncbi:putative P-loop containing nucleoside triphosphate hydrolase, leucine-rich repeat domain superfamily [Helianthus annuus]|nr:putative P-loop containing nucleoside triphosphate hydrolase, leucine-rich repeat domain superfamily [Helianthus annuus]
MAEAAALVSDIFEKLADEAFTKYARSQNIHSELKELGITLSQIQALLNDASRKEITNKSVKQWLNSLQHLAYDLDAVLDDLATEARHRELTQESGAGTSKIRKIIQSCCTNFSLSHRLRHELDCINTMLQHLEKQKSDLGLLKIDEKPKNTSRRNETSLPDGSSVIGREVEKEKLLKKLLGDDGSSKENFSIVPIVGMGGVGKTTLARILYNDTRVKDHFEPKIWVCVSDEFDTFKISKTIFQDVSKEEKEFEDLNKLQMAIAREIKDKRFLAVLDDVWNENYDDWESLVHPFHSGAYGSRVIMTTRKQKLLKEIGFNRLDLLQSLSGEDALSLLALHALGVDNFDSHKTLKPQAESIVKKCGGLPLALKAIGRLLRTKTEEEEWNDVLNSEIWNLESADEIVPALWLSYHDLSADLKRLFAYCSLFPKDFLFEKEELVLLWVAEGYLNESVANKSPECLGHECFEKLLSRSFFQRAPSGDPFFMMHDLMNDLATLVAGEYFLRFDNQMEMTEEALAKYRYMSFIREEYVAFQKFGAFEKARSLRTLLAVSAGVNKSWGTFYLSSMILVDLIPNLPFLRVLCLSRFEISEVPDSIGSLRYLTYLNLSQTKIKRLPQDVGNLYNLQTLILFGCKWLTMLPESFLKLKLLRHFDIRDTPLLEKLPVGIGEIKDLHTLTKIIIEGDNGFSITELRGLNNLHGEISIQRLHNVQSPTHAHEAKLSVKRLTKLELNWGEGSQHGRLEKEVLKELEPNSDWLKKLSIDSYPGIEFPKWVGHPSFHRLVHVLIRNCKNCASLPQLGQLPSLKELFIDGMDQVKFIGSEFTGTNQLIVGAFPSLEILRFENMQGWEVWSANSEVFVAVFPCLRELQIKDCPKLIKVSVEELPSLEVLKIDRCDVCVLRRMVHVASSITKLEIMSIFGLTYEVWKGVMEYLGAVEEIRIYMCNEISYLWESETEARGGG